MTEQYGRSTINAAPYTPIALTTPNAVPVDTVLGNLTRDGQMMNVLFFGGGSDPAALAVNNYISFGIAAFTREAGIVSDNGPTIAVNVNGAAVAYALVGVGDDVVLRITGPAFPYNHNVGYLCLSC
jgi:hypothetical protein